jgi:beta-lactamase superfamily II metal-dependent hydrolase
VSIVLVPAALWLQFGPSGEWVWVGGLADLTERALMIFLASMPVHMWHPAVTNWGAAGLCLALFGCRQLAFVFLLIWLSFGLQRTSTVVALEILDVGQGSSALLHLPGQDPVLIDGGPPGRQVVSYLRRRGHTRLSLVVASHGDLDHVGGLIPVLEDLQVDELWVGGRSAAPALNGLALARHIPVRDCAQALTRSVAFELWCDPDPATENDGSLVIRHAGAVILGDLSAEGEAAYLRASPVPAEVVVLAHHGSRHSSAAETFEILQPKLAIVSAGRHNSYGHPHPSVIQRLNKRNTPVLSTANSGSITLSFGSTTTLRMHQPGLGWSSWLSLDELQRDGLRIETQQRPTWRESWRRLVNN